MTYKDIPGYCDYEDFYREVFEQLPQFGMMAEIGVFKGRGIIYMATLELLNNKGISIIAVDNFKGSAEHNEVNLMQDFLMNMAQCGVDQLIDTLSGESVEIARKFEENIFDFVFIDASHDYESVKADIYAWLPKVRSGGILAGHDYCDTWPGVKKAVDEIFPQRELKSKSVWMIRK